MAQYRDRSLVAGLLAAMAIAGAAPVAAQDRGLSYTLYGTPGLIDMPSALAAPDGEIATTLGFFRGHRRGTFTFQVTPRLSGSFRYASVDEYTLPGEPAPRDGFVYFDRSFDLRYQIRDEGGIWPAISVGLQDFLGTGQYSSEYIVATKALNDSLRVTAGLGWGRMGSQGGFDNPLGALSSYFDTRPALNFGEGGRISTDQFFRGDAAFFGGVEYAVNERLTLKAEYSSDAYSRESELGLIDVRSPLNYGLTWRPRPGYQIGLSYLYGSEIALSGTVILNPNQRPFPGGLEPPPPPVAVRAADVRAAQSWDMGQQGQLQARLSAALAEEGVTLSGLAVTDRTIRLRYTNTRYRAEAQAMGRIARILTRELPPAIETITLEPMQRGMAMSSVTLTRSDIERLENQAGGSAEMLARAQITDAAGAPALTPVAPVASPLSWGIAPYLALYVFDGDKPLNYDAGFVVTGQYTFSPNLIASGRLRQSLVGTDDPGSVAPSNLPPVRRNIGRYVVEGNPGIENLTLAYYARPGRDLYSRVTVGLLEPMFGGVSAELLWKPVGANYGIGVEVNQVVQRDFDMLLGFQDYQTTTGHASVYYDFRNGFHGQVDVGRYLAGDWGATVALDRAFANGWRIGGYVTLTDVPFEDFGEGSFDKGIRLSIPFDYVLGQPSRREISNTLTSLTRDGGARLVVDGRLYETVRDGHLNDLSDGWGRFWR